MEEKEPLIKWLPAKDFHTFSQYRFFFLRFLNLFYSTFFGMILTMLIILWLLRWLNTLKKTINSMKSWRRGNSVVIFFQSLKWIFDFFFGIIRKFSPNTKACLFLWLLTILQNKLEKNICLLLLITWKKKCFLRKRVSFWLFKIIG